MRILALATYPAEAAATRFRIGQFIEPLRQLDIHVDLRPFLSVEQFRDFYQGGNRARQALGIARSLISRLSDVSAAKEYDLIFVQREAMFFGPEVFERLIQLTGSMPMVLDLDDATYVRYTSPTFGKLGSALKFFGKTDRLIDRAAVVTCGNRFIAEYVESRGTRAEVIPTVVDPDVWRPIEKNNEPPVIGWIGTHSTLPSLEWLYPVFTRLAETHDFILRIVGSGRESISIESVKTDVRPWNRDRELRDFQEIDIGVYPILSSANADIGWINGKSGFKAFQYLAVGIPFVMSPVGVCAEIGSPTITHFNAESSEDWYLSLRTLLSDQHLRSRMGDAGRSYFVHNFPLSKQVQSLSSIFRAFVPQQRS